MDEQRIQNVAYQYLCRLEEAKRWLEACLKEELPAPTELEDALRNGVIVAKLGNLFAPGVVPLKKIYDLDQQRYQAVGLQFRHTDNIIHWRNAMTTLGLPVIFQPETTDVYEKKNMPRAIYCIHALSLYLYRLGLAPPIHDLCGKVKFTEEEINNMKLELDKYGIQVPAFNKIGGILTNELSKDEATVHAAVIAINEAVERGNVVITAEALRNPNALITDLQEALMSIYQEVLLQTKRHKATLAASWHGGLEEKDIYEEYLTQREIQDNINTVNVRSAVEQVDEALETADEISLLSALQLPSLVLKGLCTDNASWYLDQLSADRQMKALDQGSVDPLEPDELQEGLTFANKQAERARSVKRELQCLNMSLRRSNPRHTVNCLMSSDLQLPPVFSFAAAFYHRELQLLQRQTAQGELQHEELYVATEMLSAVALINQAIDAQNLQQFNLSLVSASVGLNNVDQSLMGRYFDSLTWMKQEVGSNILTWNQLQEGINSVQKEHQQTLAVGLINEALTSRDHKKLLSALLLPSSGVAEVLSTNACRYHCLLTRARLHKSQLSFTDIQEGVWRANQQTQKALKLCLSVAAVNQAMKENSMTQTLRVLCLPEVGLHGVMSQCAAEYQQELNARITHKQDNRSPWVRVQLEDGSSYFFHLNRLEGSWEEPHKFIHNSVFLDQQEIQEVVSSVSASYSRSLLWKSSEALITRLQAASRGFLIRQHFEGWQHYLHRQTEAATIIQSNWRKFVQQRAYKERLRFLYLNWRAVVKIQSFVRMWLVRRKYQARLCFFRYNIDAVVKIQAFFRANRARGEYRMLVHSDTPRLSVIRKFVHLLDLGDSDIREESELLQLREEVVRTIRFNRHLEADLNLMDLKIGLLVRNRATLQELVSHCKKLTKKNKEQLSDMMDVKRGEGLKALSRGRRERLEAYQHLFYLLQIQPSYLAQLIVLMPQSRSTSFMEMLVFSLFNYGSSPREAFLLLQLFTEALQYEIRWKVDQPQDVVTGNPTVIKMLVSFYRHAHGQNILQDIMGLALQDILLDQILAIRTDPLDVYKSWINQTESQTGNKSSLPYDVSAEEALSHPEVQRRINVAIVNLKNLTDRVLKAITSNLHKLPYGLRYTAKVLRDALKTKFPEASDNELYKIVGNLIYYRYMNPAIVAPDGFNVVERSAGSALQPGQRHILGSIARMLQHAATNKYFNGDGPHVTALNQYISHTHTKFRKFLLGVCDVPEPKERFKMNEYSELLMVTKPVIYISVSELLNTHKLLLEHQKVLCLESSDPLRLLLKDIGPVPTLQELMGTTTNTTADSGSNSSQSTKIEVSLTLSDKFEIFNGSDDTPDTRRLLLTTKQMIIDVIRTQPGETLSDVLTASASHEQEVCHYSLIQQRVRQEACLLERMTRNQSLVSDCNVTLGVKKRKIERYLCHLEGLGILTPPHSHNQILLMIAKDVRHQHAHRQHRREELKKLRQTINSLHAKSSFHSEQVDYYRHYISSCLDNLTAKSKVTSKKATENRGKKVPTLSYSAARLQEKGVLLEIEDLPATQFKNVIFNIVPGPEKGTFNVKACFLGIEMEEFLLKYQDLLQLQYEGVAVMKMFNKAKVNVNLLIFLLNKKFFK
ncbi:ras GTPase-activating-like protein IQGAP3 [Aulostomus maculatus]